MPLKRVVGWFALVVGVIGLAACAAGVYGVWSVRSRLDRANDRVFTRLDDGVASAGDRIRGVQARIRESKVTSDEIARGVRTWAADKAEERAAARLEIDRRAGELARHLQTADLWLETAGETVRGVQQVLALGDLGGDTINPASLDDVLARLAALRVKVQEAGQTVDRVRELAGGNDGETSEENRRSQVTRLVARMVVTIGDIDARLDEPIARLAEAQAAVQALKVRIDRYIAVAAIACYLLLAWVAAGQVALAMWGWRGRRRTPSAEQPERTPEK
jgi:hypothetical protein